MLSFQARKKEDNYLVPVYNYMSGTNKSVAQAPTQSSSKYMSTPTSNYLPKSQNVQKPIYQPYANLQSSMKAVSKPGYVTPTVNKPAAQPQQPAANPQVPQTQPVSPMSKLQQIGQQRQQFAQTQADQEAERQKGIFDVRSKALEAQKPELETRLNNYRDLSRQSIANQEEQTRLAKQGIEQSSGEEMRLNAQTAREGRGRVQSTLAGLNALDSSTTGTLLAKAEGNLSNNQATALRSQKQQLAESDQNLLAYKQQAQLAEDNEIAKFNEAMRQISANYDINSLEYQNAVKQAYDKAQESIYNIEQGIAEQELSVQGIYDKAYAEQDAKNQVAGAGSNNEGKALTLVNRLLGGNTQAVSGTWKTPGVLSSMVPGAGAARADLEGIQNLLTLAARGQLKGSGQVSDFETKMLEKAALAGLSKDLPEDEFVRRLQQLKQDLQTGGAVASGSGGMITMQSPDGQTYQVDQGEAQEAMANGWRQV